MKTLVLGGMKSGKSRYAENLLLQSNGTRTVIATATALDDEMSLRIERHKEDRHPDIDVIEEPIYLGNAIERFNENHCVLIDCLTLWITNLLMADDNNHTLETQKKKFLESIKHTRASLVLVSNETNMGIVPLGDLTRRYCDEVGLLHQEVATHCHDVILMVAGLPVFAKSSQ